MRLSGNDLARLANDASPQDSQTLCQRGMCLVAELVRRFRGGKPQRLRNAGQCCLVRQLPRNAADTELGLT
jgi:hypothetical protein